MSTSQHTLPLITVVTIVRNGEHTLANTMQSVLSQTYSNIEYIIVDGASTDGTLEIIKLYGQQVEAGKFPQFSKGNYKYISEPDGGIYSAMNKGIRMAKGNWINFMNAGDMFFDSNVLEKIADLATASIVYGNTVLLKGGKEKLIQKGQTKLSFLDFYVGYISHQSTFFRKDLFEIYGMYDESYRIVADWAFYIKTIVLGNVSTQYINTLIAKYDLEGMSSSAGHKKRQQEERERVFQSLIPERILADYRKMPILMLRLYYYLSRWGLRVAIFFISRKIFKK